MIKTCRGFVQQQYTRLVGQQSQQGQALAGQIQSMRGNMVQARNQLDDRIRGSVNQVNSLLDQIAVLNVKITTAEAGRGGANGMRDQRDQLIDQVSKFLDISTVEQSTGSTDVYLNGVPLVSGGTDRGIKVDYSTSTGGSNLDLKLRVADDGTFLEATSGSIGALMKARTHDMLPAIQAVDDFSSALIWQVNRVHSQGRHNTVLEMVLAEGRNREIRRLLARTGHKVLTLKRIAIGRLRLGKLAPGDFRPLKAAEVHVLRKSVGGSQQTKRKGRQTGSVKRSRRPAKVTAAGKRNRNTKKVGTSRPKANVQRGGRRKRG